MITGFMMHWIVNIPRKLGASFLDMHKEGGIFLEITVGPQCTEEQVPSSNQQNGNSVLQSEVVPPCLNVLALKGLHSLPPEKETVVNGLSQKEINQ